jgi:hypothetical protein
LLAPSPATDWGQAVGRFRLQRGKLASTSRSKRCSAGGQFSIGRTLTEKRTSPSPKKTADGRDYLPVYEEEEANFKKSETPAAPTKGASRKIIRYRHPMGLPDTSPVPKKDSMGMDYIPVYEGEDDDGSTVR